MLPAPPRTADDLGSRLRSVALRYRPPLARSYEHRTPWPSGPRFGTARPEDNEVAASATARTAAMARLEAVLFIAREPLSSRKLAQLADLPDGTKARTLARALNRHYDKENRAFRVVDVAGGLQLRTRPKFAPWLRRLCSSPVEVRLSGPAMETLAVVAYRQPVLRVAVEAVRGVQCGEILRQLMERDLVKIVGRSEELGRPFLYGTTRRFLQVFGLKSLDELPRRERLQLDEPPPETLEEETDLAEEDLADDVPNEDSDSDSRQIVADSDQKTTEEDS